MEADHKYYYLLNIINWTQASRNFKHINMISHLSNSWTTSEVHQDHKLTSWAVGSTVHSKDNSCDHLIPNLTRAHTHTHSHNFQLNPLKFKQILKGCMRQLYPAAMEKSANWRVSEQYRQKDFSYNLSKK